MLSPIPDSGCRTPAADHCAGPAHGAAVEPAAAASAASVVPPFAVECLGRIAHTLMSEHRRGDVIAVFRRSFYIRFGDGVVCLGGRGIGQGPLNGLCRTPPELSWNDRMAPGAAVVGDGATLMIGGRFCFDYTDAAAWQAPRALTVAVPAIHAGLTRLATASRRRAPGGFGALLALPPDAVASAGMENAEALLRSATPAIAALREWLTAALGGSPQPPPDVATLIGLGPGLTPSGDDFLCGVMATLHYLGRGAVARRLADGVLPTAAAATNLISAAYLRCAAEGEASAVLFDVLGCIAAGGDGRLEACLEAVHRVGHTSGWDTLAGAAAACAALCAAGVEGGLTIAG
jgi:Protein of unknown function (DUF2877)